jgi:hypothetical protein
MADRCSELEQQKAALSDTMSHERAAASASAAAASAAAVALQAEVADLRGQVRMRLCAFFSNQYFFVNIVFQLARAPSAQDMAALQMQLQLHAAGAQSTLFQSSY